ncbi:PIN-like domain-containing protein [Fusibacter ferrireducens]|uniref:PIN like domain-containing protein n=1 Tax=Fusibacter ferrireducens TaxID=2785058 RepID=A0ABR9ZM31_9FIRM|nr:PIN-like domain-containing protein [Fusibacter ferrireducens]MBF4691481.1 hypothetical protein [Fusibacter ferrireducens]
MEISKEFGFKAKFKKYDFKFHSSSLRDYSNKFDTIIKFDTDCPVFLDANVILQIYKMSLKSRTELMSFFDEKKAIIYVTKQVEQEFVKNRIGVHQSYVNAIKKELVEDFKSKILNSAESYYNSKKLLLEDFDDLNLSMQDLITSSEKMYSQMTNLVEVHINTIGDVEFNDPYWNVIENFNYIDNLSEEEIAIIKSDFDELKKNIGDVSKVKDYITKNSTFVFPGIGDLKEKNDDPYGDYIIYHEIIKFMETHATDAFFLTFDTTKGDWMDESKKPHLHYIENVFMNTNKTLFILDAKRVFNDLLEINTDSLVENRKLSNDIYFKVKFDEFYLDISNAISSACIEYGIAIDYFDNPDLLYAVEELNKNGLVYENLVLDIHEILVYKKVIDDDTSDLSIYNISSRKRILDKMEVFLDDIPNEL